MPIDLDRIRNKLQDIANALARLRRLRDLSRSQFLADEDSQDIARSRLLTAIEAALNICYHFSAQKIRKVPEDYADCFTILGSAKMIDPELAKGLGDMARFRNRLVHLYWDIEYGQVYDIIVNNIDDLEAFSVEIAQNL